MAKHPVSCFVPINEEEFEKWKYVGDDYDKEKVLHYAVYEDEEILFWPAAKQINKKYNLLIEAYEEEVIPYECLKGCLEIMNEIDGLKEGQISKALQKGIELKMPVIFCF